MNTQRRTIWKEQCVLLRLPSPLAETVIVTCLKCNRPTGHQSLHFWCRKCRLFQRQRGQARGLARSAQTRRLKALLKNFSPPR